MNRQPFDPFADLALSPAHKAAARKQLDVLAEQTHHSQLRDLARDVLSGRMNVRGALHDPRATAVLEQEVSRFTAWYRELPGDQLAEHERRAEEYADEATREAVAPAARKLRQRRDDEADWEEPRPILKKRRR